MSLLFLAVVLNIDKLLSRGEPITHDWSVLSRFLLGKMVLRIGILEARRAKKMEMEEEVRLLV